MLWRLMRQVLDPALGYRAARAMTDALAPLPGRDAFDWLAARLALQCDVAGLEHLPRSGGALLVANHPTGIADGVALWTALRAHRADLAFFANRDAVRVAPGLADCVIPVEWVLARRTRARTRETLQAAGAAFAAGRMVVMFPSGRLAHRATDGHLRERPWLPTALALARRHRVPVVPVGITMRNSALFYRLSRIADPLRDITLFHELLNKQGARYRLRIAAPLQPDGIGPQADLHDAIRALQRHVEDELVGPIRLD